MSTSSRPLILLGLDAMDVELVQHWAREGTLPGFQRLLETAAQGHLDSPVQVMQGSIWPSFVTGLNPGRHGLYFMTQLSPGTTELKRMLASDMQQLPFWAHHDVAAGPVAVVDVPKLRVVGRPGDTQVVEWGALDHFSQFSTYPESLARSLGRHPLQQAMKAPWGDIGRRRLAKRLQTGVRQKDALNRRLLRQGPQMLLSVFGEAHAAGHYLWPTGEDDPRPSSDGELCAVYRTLDDVLSGLVDDYAANANIILFSGHGMLADTIPSGVLEVLLTRMGETVEPAQTQSDGGLGTGLARLAGRLPYGVRRLANESLIPAGIQRRLVRAKGFTHADLTASRAFVLPSDHQGFIRINLEGREPGGCVAAKDYAQLCERIEEQVLRLRNADTGEAVVERVLRPRDLWPGGECLDALPDLCVVWKPLPRAAATFSSAYGPIPVKCRHPERSGNHRLSGFFFALGPDIDTNTRSVQGNLLDIAPTAMHLLGGCTPAGLDGEILPIVS